MLHETENNKTFTIRNVTADTIILQQGENLVNEAAGALITLVSDKGSSVTSSSIAFLDSNLDTIVDSEGEFVKSGFSRKQRITVLNSLGNKNDRTFTIAELTDGEIILKQGNSVIAQGPGTSVTLQVGSLGGVFWLCTIICIVSFIFGLTMMPETKGRTLEEIAESWKKK